MLLLLNHVDAAHVAFYVDSSECACIHTVDTLRNCKSVCMCVCVLVCDSARSFCLVCALCVQENVQPYAEDGVLHGCFCPCASTKMSGLALREKNEISVKTKNDTLHFHRI